MSSSSDVERSQGALQAAQLEEAEALGEGEVLVQQAVALERAVRDRQQRLVVGKADRADRARGQHLEPLGRPPGRQHERPESGAEDELVERVRDVVAAAEIEAQPFE